MTFKNQLVELVALKEEPGGYTILVFSECEIRNSYTMCTKLPNWNTKTPSIGDIGYLETREVIAGVDTWYDIELDAQIPYKYTGIYFWNFVHKKEKQQMKLTL